MFEKIRSLIASQMNVDEDKITIDTNLVEDLKADSLDVVELIMDLEQEFDLEIPDEDLPKVTTVREIVDYIQSRTGNDKA